MRLLRWLLNQAHLRALQRLFHVTCPQRWHQQRVLPSLFQQHYFHNSRKLWNLEEADTRTSNTKQNVEENKERKSTILPHSKDSLVFNGIPFEKIPVVHIKASYNNTIITVTDHVCADILLTCSCGTEGFKNAKKSTSIAGQTVGIAAATKALAKGVKMVRVMVRGLGPGRQSSIKGLQMGGLDIISITDNTPVPHNGCRPRKARRLWGVAVAVNNKSIWREVMQRRSRSLILECDWRRKN